MVEVEVEFNPIVPRANHWFADRLHRDLRHQGFVLWRLAHLAHYSLPGGISLTESHDTHHFAVDHPVTVTGTGGQLFWRDAFVDVRWELAFPRDLIPWNMPWAMLCSPARWASGTWPRGRSAWASGVPPAVAAALEQFVRSTAPG